MQIGTAIFLVGAMVIAFAFWASVYWGRIVRAQTERMIEESRRMDAEIEEARADIRRGARRTENRFKL